MITSKCDMSRACIALLAAHISEVFHTYVLQTLQVTNQVTCLGLCHHCWPAHVSLPAVIHANAQESVCMQAGKGAETACYVAHLCTLPNICMQVCGATQVRPTHWASTWFDYHSSTCKHACSPALIPGGGSCSSSLYCACIALHSLQTQSCVNTTMTQEQTHPSIPACPPDAAAHKHCCG